MLRPTRSLAVASIAAAVLLVSAASAQAQFKVDRTLVTLSSRTPSALLKLDNTSDHEIRFDIQVHGWSVAQDGTDQLTPTKDVTVVPAIATLKPGQSQNIRVGSTAAAGPMERAYRLMIEELPGPAGSAGANTVAMRTRFSIPVFVDPVKVEARIEVGPPTLVGDRMLEVAVTNTGTVHRFIDSIEFTVVDAKGGKVFSTKGPTFGYLLVGATRKLTSGSERSTLAQCKAGAKLMVTLTTRRDSVTHEYPFDPSTECGK
jgi:fimbrial chaperone protein